MEARTMRAAGGLFILCTGLAATAAELSDCVKFAVTPDGTATLTNGCTSRLNMIYCVDNPNSARACSEPPLGVTTLSPGGVERFTSYKDDGAGTVYWAVCVYPEAPLNWKPRPDNTFICRKTCVMC